MRECVGEASGCVLNFEAIPKPRNGVMRQIQTGYLYTYAFAMIIGLTILLGWLIWLR